MKSPLEGPCRNWKKPKESMELPYARAIHSTGKHNGHSMGPFPFGCCDRLLCLHAVYGTDLLKVKGLVTSRRGGEHCRLTASRFQGGQNSCKIVSQSTAGGKVQFCDHDHHRNL